MEAWCYPAPGREKKNPGEALYPEKCEEQGMVSPVWKQLFHLCSLFQGQIPDKKPFPLLFPRISITSGALSIPFLAGFWGQLERTNKNSLWLFVSYKQWLFQAGSDPRRNIFPSWMPIPGEGKDSSGGLDLWERPHPTAPGRIFPRFPSPWSEKMGREGFRSAAPGGHSGAAKGCDPGIVWEGIPGGAALMWEGGTGNCLLSKQLHVDGREGLGSGYCGAGLGMP